MDLNYTESQKLVFSLPLDFFNADCIFFADCVDFSFGNLLVFILFFAFIAALIAESFIDIKHYIIPDSLSIYAAPIAIVGMYFKELKLFLIR